MTNRAAGDAPTPAPAGPTRRTFATPLRALSGAVGSSWAAPYLDAILRGWRIIVLYAFVAAAGGAAATLLLPNVYAARASFIADTPQQPNLSGSLAQFAGQFGLLNLAGGTRAPEFYRDLLSSQRVLLALARTRVRDPRTDSLAPIYKLYSRGRIDSLTRRNRDRILKTLTRNLDATVDARTSIIRVELGGPDPDVAAEALDSLLVLTNAFAVNNLRTRASARRQFAQVQTDATHQALEDAEGALRQFYERNRRIADSPALQFEETSLRRRVDLQQELYLTLSRELEQAKLDEVRDTPVLSTIDPPLPPSRHERPKRRALTVLAFLFGAFVAAAGIVLDLSRQPYGTTSG